MDGGSRNIEYTEAEIGAKFPEVMQHVRAGKTVIVLCDGEPWAEIRLPQDKTVPGETRREYLVRIGAVTPAKGKWNPPLPTVRVEGALERFLKERG